MEHFAVIQALCRAALSNSSSSAVQKQVERLRDALRADGDTRDAGALDSLLSSTDRTASMSPSRIVRSGTVAISSGEELSARTILPVDKETSSPLAEIHYPGDVADPPILDAQVSAAVQSLLHEWQHIEMLESIGVAPSRSCLIYGAPGTGKTRLAMWMAGELGLPVVLARLDGLISSFLGTTARNVSALFAFANRYRCVLLLDEFDAIAKLRDDPQEVGEIKRVVNAVLQNLDTRRPIGLTIGITNHESLLDRAIWRRFESQLSIPRPTYDARVVIAQSYAGPVNLPGVLVRIIAWLTEGATGADIEMLIKSLKKEYVLAKPNETRAPLDSVLQFLSLHSGRIADDKREILRLPSEELARRLIQDANLGFDQNDLALAFGRDKATISRWMKRPKLRRLTKPEQ